ncbi:MAG TPA: amylo-alpha-1,6-glucosidase [Thermoanaerobaculia bacterium]|jgi:predicted glycogen debranching enzyme|nr:amylo-alpha-1,6-glucosidase [Thermoanaerobaculia bacterium]
MPSGQPFPRQIGWKRGDPQEALLAREWLVTNGLGGYSSGTIGGAATRRFHGKLIAALPAPLGRFMMLNHLEESVDSYKLSGDEHGGGKEIAYPEPDFLEEFVLECGLPVWRYSKNGIRIEKRVVMPHLQNTTYITYKLLEGPSGLTLHLRPSLKFRPHEGLVNEDVSTQWDVKVNGREVEISDGRGITPLRLILIGNDARLASDERQLQHVIYRIERSRGYEHEGTLWSPGVIQIAMNAGETAGIVASVEAWDVVRALGPDECCEAELARREKLLAMSGRQEHRQDNFSAQLVLAADQFLVRPGTRAGDAARIAAMGDEPRTVIAGYHWFTDWGRDTMISLEGLTLATNRNREAGNILRTFASYIRDGLIPNLFPEGERGGLYHTADATMWFFHAIKRYVDYTGDRETLRALLPKLIDIIDHHVRGTHFNIHVDPNDGLLAQGAEGYQLTWMDAKVDGWVVTPRRGKAVEINALYYNALRILQQYLVEEGDTTNARRMEELALRARTSFNARFWNAQTQCLYDVVDCEGGGDDPAIRPNQIFSVSLPYPVLDESRWRSVVDVVRAKLLTPMGLRSLSPDHPDYKPKYDGDLRARDAAYHQGTVWAWLIGPFLEAWLRVNPGDREGALALLEGFAKRLGDSCIGTISEVFDAEPPYHPRGCASQAWSVAEVLRGLRALR